MNAAEMVLRTDLRDKEAVIATAKRMAAQDGRRRVVFLRVGFGMLAITADARCLEGGEVAVVFDSEAEV